MTTIYGRFSKQSGETLDYVVDFSEWFENRTDGPSYITVEVEPGVTLASRVLVGTRAVLTLSGGVSGRKYKVTVRMITDATPVPIVKEVDFIVAIKDI